MSTLATLVVKLVGDISGYSASLEKAERQTGGVLGNIGKLALGAGAAAVGAFAAIGGAALASAMKLDDAYDTIQVGTGATGDVLESLKDDFGEVFKNVPADAGATSDVIMELNRRLGMTGPFLQNTSAAVLELSRLTGGDAKTNAALFSRVVGDWGLPLEDASTSLDAIFVASQKTGVGVDKLMTQVVQFGSPLRLMGFSLTESAALLAKWEKEGVNAELVMGSLRIAAGKLARENKPLREGLLQTFDAIKNAKTPTESLSIAMKMFGARAGPDMAAAIMEGRFAVDDLILSMQNADGAIMDTASATEDFPEKFERLRNRVELALAPLGGAIMDGIGAAIDFIGPRIEAVAPIFEKAFQTVGNVFERVVGILGIVVTWVETNWPAIQTAIVGVFEKARAVAEPIINAIGTIIQTVFTVVGQFLATHGEEIAAFFQTAWGTIQNIIQTVTTIIQQFIVPWLQGVATFIQTHADAIKGIFETVWNGIKIFVETVLGVIQGIVNTVLAVFRGDWETAWNGIKDIFETVWNGMKAAVENIFNAAGGILQIVLDALTGLFNWIKESFIAPVEEAWGAFWGGLRDFAASIINGIVGFISGLLDSIGQAIDALGRLAGAGAKLDAVKAAQDAASGGGNGNVPGGQHGLSMVVPPGFPNDSFLLRASSGEQVDITPSGHASPGGMQLAFAAGSIIIYGGNQSAESIARAVLDEAMRRADNAHRAR